MTIEAERRIHERLDEIATILGKLRTDIETTTAVFSLVRPVVLGNGKAGIAERVGRLETKLFMLWPIASAVVAAVVTAIIIKVV